MSSQSSYFTPQGCPALTWGSPRRGSAGVLSWALPSWGLLWDQPGCFVLTTLIHLQRVRLHGWREVPTALTIPHNPSPPSLLVSSHSAAPGMTRAPFLRSQDTPVNANSWAQPEPQVPAWKAFVPLVCPAGLSPTPRAVERSLARRCWWQAALLGMALLPPDRSQSILQS